MNKKKPILEKVYPGFGSSVLVKKHTEFLKTNKASWHFHPELELVYVNKGQGKRHIGNHLSYFNNSQLLLIGPNLPHNGFTDRLTTNGFETLIQFKEDFLGTDFFEIGYKIEKLVEKNGFKKLLVFLEILNILSKTEDYTILNVDGYAVETEFQDSSKLDTIYKHINTNFKEHISLDQIASVATMTVPAFCRYFKKVTGKTFTKLVNEYRVVHATKLLSESTMSITDIAYECGFNNFSHFNKLFKEITGKNASGYRKEMKGLLQ